MRALLLILLTIAGPASAATSTRPVDVMVLGTVHFANPGQDLHNAKIDDVLVPKRQAEIAAVAEAIARFRPTKIMIEREATTADLVDPKYAAFTPADLRTVRDERVQLGYRIARTLEHRRVYAIDEQPAEGEPDYFPFQRLDAWAKANGRAADLAVWNAGVAAEVKRLEAIQARESVAGWLIEANRADGFFGRPDVNYDLLNFGGIDDQTGADLNAGWYQRNAKIFAKLMRAAAPGDRVLVIYGAGHNYWLRHFAQETRGYRFVDPVPYLRQAVARR